MTDPHEIIEAALADAHDLGMTDALYAKAIVRALEAAGYTIALLSYVEGMKWRPIESASKGYAPRLLLAFSNADGYDASIFIGSDIRLLASAHSLENNLALQTQISRLRDELSELLCGWPFPWPGLKPIT